MRTSFVRAYVRARCARTCENERARVHKQRRLRLHRDIGVKEREREIKRRCSSVLRTDHSNHVRHSGFRDKVEKRKHFETVRKKALEERAHVRASSEKRSQQQRDALPAREREMKRLNEKNNIPC